MKKNENILTVGKKKAIEIIKNSKGFVGVTVKTKEKESRKMNFNYGSAKNDHAELGMLIVNDRTVQGTRTINLQNLKEVRTGGKIYKIKS